MNQKKHASIYIIQYSKLPAQLPLGELSWTAVPRFLLGCPLNNMLVDPTSLSSCNLWWNGTHWLTQTPEAWPNLVINVNTDIPDVKEVHISTINPPDGITWGFSKLSGLVRVTAYYKRFIFNLRQTKSNKETSPLSPQTYTLL